MRFTTAAARKPTGTMHAVRGPRAEPFEDVEQAWFWTMGALRARHDGASAGRGSVPRPCEPDDVVRCLDQLYRHRRIDLAHARILRSWGERQMAPGADNGSRHDAALWREALGRLDCLLRGKGIISNLGNKTLTHAGMSA
jgi:hypothetical protein